MQTMFLLQIMSQSPLGFTTAKQKLIKIQKEEGKKLLGVNMIKNERHEENHNFSHNIQTVWNPAA